MTLADGAPEVLPRFVSLSLTDNLFLIFLDDSRLFSDRAEELTLATLGRLSASIAHEIRNPLAAINYSRCSCWRKPPLPEADRRLLEIIHTQCQRMNGIVQDILGLARRERRSPTTVECQFARRFVDEYRASHPRKTDVLQAVSEPSHPAIADPRHLHQVLTILVQNALTYGRMPGEPAKVTVAVRRPRPAPRRISTSPTAARASRRRWPTRSSRPSIPPANTAPGWACTSPSNWRNPTRRAWNTCRR